MTTLPAETDAARTDPLAHDAPLPGATVRQAVQRVTRRATVFTGRASRSELWWVVLLNALVWLGAGALTVVAARIGDAIRPSRSSDLGLSPGPVLGVLIVLALLTLYVLVTLVPLFAVSARRLHDANLPAWWLLLAVVPGLGALALLVLLALPSNPAGARFDRASTERAPVEGPAST
ncbi:MULTISPECIES: DUF805 domain-containing protein [Cellulomonas]|uniref:Uncharacterized membrane protein YhaH (DUF805 family) n=1 Tax=Cellulomonas iranensis TaxID=76862 RepID=A0ABU0GJJ3_9CELL|nr:MULTISPECIES: DUF805 domain-containing protein [Cellulomonas]MDQ0425537.1 uncharacterized membrane protein YhaH (DUF805 family) [Cellulomonas iranensis]